MVSPRWMPRPVWPRPGIRPPRRFRGRGAPPAGRGAPWNPDPNGPPAALAGGGGWVYAGGDFGLVNNLPQSNLAAIEAEQHPPDCSHAAAVPAQIQARKHRL